MGYAHIDNLYKEQTILMFRECYALEKIHGTSAHISWKGKQLWLSSGGIQAQRLRCAVRRACAHRCVRGAWTRERGCLRRGIRRLPARSVLALWQEPEVRCLRGEDWRLLVVRSAGRGRDQEARLGVRALYAHLNRSGCHRCRTRQTKRAGEAERGRWRSAERGRGLASPSWSSRPTMAAA